MVGSCDELALATVAAACMGGVLGLQRLRPWVLYERFNE